MVTSEAHYYGHFAIMVTLDKSQIISHSKTKEQIEKNQKASIRISGSLPEQRTVIKSIEI